jgi:hypothetical protein
MVDILLEESLVPFPSSRLWLEDSGAIMIPVMDDI